MAKITRENWVAWVDDLIERVAWTAASLDPNDLERQDMLADLPQLRAMREYVFTRPIGDRPLVESIYLKASGRDRPFRANDTLGEDLASVFEIYRRARNADNEFGIGMPPTDLPANPPTDLEPLLERVRDALGPDAVDIHGPQPDQAIEALENALGRTLPDDFKVYLRQYGLLAFADGDANMYSGITDGDPFSEQGGSAYGETVRLRTEHRLPKHLLVIRMDPDGDAPSCLDLARLRPNRTCPVVGYMLYNGDAWDEAQSFYEWVAARVDMMCEDPD